MVATLMVVMILGVLATIVLTVNLGSAPHVSGTTTPFAPTTTIPASVSGAGRMAAETACHADYQLLATAVADYRALNGATPPTGNTWATSSANGGPFLQAWPRDVGYFVITWNGSTLAVVPVKGRTSRGTDGVRTPASGCFAI